MILTSPSGRTVFPSRGDEVVTHSKDPGPKATPRLRLCIVSHYAYGAMTGGANGYVGGVEWQTSMKAKWFAARGHEVSLLTWDEGQPDDCRQDDVKVFKICRQDAGLPGLRFIYPRWSGLVAALQRADADVYYQNCGEYVTGQVAWWCRRHGKAFVYSVASDPDCDPRLPQMRKIRERVLYRYGLRHADRIIVQTRAQQRMLRDGFDLESTVIPMPCRGPSNDDYVAPTPPEPGNGRVLWVGRIVPLKRLEWLLDVAEALPHVSFDVVGPFGGPLDYVGSLRRRAAMIPNVALHGCVCRDDMPGLYQRAACLCCNSEYEGFPNTFLEAWGHGLPVVSTVDPDDLITTRNLGIAARDSSGLKDGIQRLLQSPDEWRLASQNARDYYLENHTLEATLPRFERVFRDVIASKSSCRLPPI